MSKKKIAFIVNPVSGRRKLVNLEELIETGIDQQKFDFSVHYTNSAGHASQLTKIFIEQKTDIVVAVGGDGTVNEIGTQLIDTETVLAIIPGGSGNGLARHLGIPLSTEKAISLINTGKLSRIDTAKVNQTTFISIAGVGFDALVAKLFEGNLKRGFLTYLSIIIQQFSKYREKKYTLEFENGEKITTRALFISFANSNQFGYNASIAPNAKLNDGLLDICIVKKPGILDFPLLINLLLLKKIDQSPFVNILPVSQVIIRQSKNRYVNIDGEAVKLKKKLKVEIRPKSLNVIIPDK